MPAHHRSRGADFNLELESIAFCNPLPHVTQTSHLNTVHKAINNNNNNYNSSFRLTNLSRVKYYVFIILSKSMRDARYALQRYERWDTHNRDS